MNQIVLPTHVADLNEPSNTTMHRQLRRVRTLEGYSWVRAVEYVEGEALPYTGVLA
jgi:hypothetical protein